MFEPSLMHRGNKYLKIKNKNLGVGFNGKEIGLSYSTYFASILSHKIKSHNTSNDIFGRYFPTSIVSSYEIQPYIADLVYK